MVFTEINLKILNASDTIGLGITSNIDNCKTSKWSWEFNKGETYYVAAGNGNDGAAWYGQYNSDSNAGDNPFDPPPWINNDIITLKIDCDQCKLTYLQNGKDVGSFNIKPNLTYHLCISSNSKGHKYKIID